MMSSAAVAAPAAEVAVGTRPTLTGTGLAQSTRPAAAIKLVEIELEGGRAASAGHGAGGSSKATIGAAAEGTGLKSITAQNGVANAMVAATPTLAYAAIASSSGCDEVDIEFYGELVQSDVVVREKGKLI
jgi:hypothetical protein